jgi:anti-sigma factor RsiW
MTQSELSPADEKMLHRFVDGELSGAVLADCQQRLAAEPALRQRLHDLQGLRECFAAGRREQVLAPAGFTADLMAAIRRRTLEQSWRREEENRLVPLCRRLLLAAAVLVGLAALWLSGIVRDQSPRNLEAAPDVVQREMQRLDRLIQAEEAQSGPTEERRTK